VPKIRLRTLLALVTLLAICLWQWQRASYLLREAADHEVKVGVNERAASRFQKRPGSDADREQAIAAFNARADFHRKWAQQYRSAAWIPWATSLDEGDEPPLPNLK
jgi:hypothetical protein